MIIVVTLAFSFISPVSIIVSPDSNEKILIELDICHADGPLLSSNGTTEGVCTGTCQILSPEICHTANDAPPLFYARFFPREKDRPPEV
jgi:hypothetical protein